MRILFALLLSIVLPAFALAQPAIKTQEQCPLDKEIVTGTLANRGTQTGMMLDFQPVGTIVTPWLQLECPRDGLILYKIFSPQEVAQLKTYIASPEYQALRKDHAQYWRIAKTQEALGVPLTGQAPVLLQATWQAGKHYEMYAQEAIKAYEDIIRCDVQQGEDALISHLITGELYRRLHRMDEAKAVFEALENNEECKKHDDCAPMVQQQLRLIKQNNTKDVEFVPSDK